MHIYYCFIWLSCCYEWKKFNKNQNGFQLKNLSVVCVFPYTGFTINDLFKVQYMVYFDTVQRITLYVYVQYITVYVNALIQFIKNEVKMLTQLEVSPSHFLNMISSFSSTLMNKRCG